MLYYTVVRINSDNTTFSNFPKFDFGELPRLIQMLKEETKKWEGCMWTIRYGNNHRSIDNRPSDRLKQQMDWEVFRKLLEDFRST